MTLNVQFLTMLSMVLGGFYLGIALDTYRRLSLYLKGRKLLPYLMEICFWLTQTTLLFYVLFRVNNGEIRLYVFLACILGFSIYQVIASTLYKRILEWILTIISSIYQFVEKAVQVLIISPIKWVILALLTLLLFIIQSILSVVLFIIKLIFLPIKWILQLLYQLLPKKIKKLFCKFITFYSTIKYTCKKWLKYIKFKRR